jgi:hypothetical protein
MNFVFAKTVTDVLDTALEPSLRDTLIRVAPQHDTRNGNGSDEKAAANQAQVALDTPLPADIPQPTAPPAAASSKA